MALPWKALAKRQRAQVFSGLNELDQNIRHMEEMLQRGRDNPGLLLAGLVLEAHKEGQEIGNRATECMAWAFLNYLSNHPEAPNYLEVTLGSEPGKQVYVTVQRPDGKTPHQMRVEAEVERDKLRSELESLKAMEPCQS